MLSKVLHNPAEDVDNNVMWRSARAELSFALERLTRLSAKDKLFLPVDRSANS
jgi:hypothetical protein